VDSSPLEGWFTHFPTELAQTTMALTSFAAIVCGKNKARESEDYGVERPEKTGSGSSGASHAKILPDHRRQMKDFVQSKRFEAVIGVSILFNMMLIILETDAHARGEQVNVWINRMNKVLLSLYVIELLTKLYIFRLNFFSDGWNNVDFIIVFSDVVLLVLDVILAKMPKLTVLRLVRLVRLARAFKAATMFKELAMILRGFVRAFAAIFWGIILILLLLTVWSILAVQIIHPINLDVASKTPGPYDGCIRCKDAFSSVFASLVTFFQTVVAGDSWGTVAVPIIEHEPISGIFFLCVLVSVSLAIMNLILAVIVDSSQDSKSDIQEEQLIEQQQEYEEARKTFLELCSDLDADGNGTLTKDEIVQGIQHPHFGKVMKAAKLCHEDVDNLFDVLDFDGSGAVNYNEFVDFFSKFRAADLSLLVLEITRLQRMVMQHLQVNPIKKTPRAGCKSEEEDLAFESQMDTQIAKEPFQNPVKVAQAVQHASLSEGNVHHQEVLREDTRETRDTAAKPEEIGFDIVVPPAEGIISTIPALTDILDGFGPLHAKKTLCPLERPHGDSPCDEVIETHSESEFPMLHTCSKSPTGRRSFIDRQHSFQSFRLWPCWRNEQTNGEDDDMLALEDENNETDDFDDHSSEGSVDEDIQVEVASGQMHKPCLIANPNSKRRLVWDLLGMSVLCYDMVMIPITQAFTVDEEQVFIRTASRCTLIFWTLDIVASFTVGYFNRLGQLVMSPFSIACHYVRTWLILDCLLVLIDWAMLLFAGESSRPSGLMRFGKLIRALRILRTLRLLRLAKLKQIMAAIQDRLDSEFLTIGLNVMKHMMLIVVINHFIACMWFKLGTTPVDGFPSWVAANNFSNVPVVYQYLISLHWSLTQFTPASMRVEPVNIPERLVAILVLLFAMIIFSSFVSSITTAMNQLRNLSAKNGSQLWLLRKYLREQNISGDLYQRLIRYASVTADRMQHKVQRKDVGFLAILSGPLHSELATALHKPIICRHPFFETLGRRSVALTQKLCCSVMKQLGLSRGDVLFRAGEEATCLYFLTSGTMKYDRKFFQSVESVGPASWCCEAVVWVPWIHVGKMRASGECELLAVNSNDFQNLTSLHPTQMNWMRQYGRCFVDRLNTHMDAVSDLATGWNF